MTFDLQKALNLLLLLLTISLGTLMGRFSANLLGMSLTPTQPVSESVTADVVSIKKYRLQDFNSISQRNLFDSAAQPTSLEEPLVKAEPSQSTEKAAPASRTDLKLLGTVSGGESQLAVIAEGRKAEVYRVGDTLPGKLTLVEVQRDKAIVESAAGQQSVLELVVEQTRGKSSARSKATQSKATSTAKVVELGENRWQIPKEEAEKARSNLNALLKTARMVPKIVNGETQGFTIVSLKAGTFLDLLGLKVGDVLVQINDVELNSPEKALQIFQQVREANNISLGLLRNGGKQTFEYTID